MDRHSRPTPGSGRSGGKWVCTSEQTYRRTSTPLTGSGTRLIPALNAAAGDTEGWSRMQPPSSSSRGVDLGLNEWHPIYNRRGIHPEFSSMPNSNTGRHLFHDSAMRPRTTDDDVLVMDGVLVANSPTSRSRGYASFSDIGYGYAGSPRSNVRGRHGSNRQLSYGKEESRMVRAMNPMYSEMQLQRGRSMQVPGYNMQTVPGPYHHFLPQSLPGTPFPPPRGPTSNNPTRPPAAPYFMQARETATAPARGPPSSSRVLKQPEVKPPPPAQDPPPPTTAQDPPFSWPPSEETEAAITQVLYGPRRRRRLPVFESICPS